MNIVWVALPMERRPENRLALSVFVSPRLDVDGILGDVDRMVDWPDYVNSLTFSVNFNDTDVMEATFEPVDPKWWGKLFTAETPLQAHEIPDHSTTIIHTFPVQSVLGFIQSTYKTVAESSPTEFPALATLESMIGPIRPASYLDEFNGTYEQMVGTETETEIGTALVRALAPGTPIGGMSPLTSDFFRAHRFYRRLEQQATADNTTAPDRPEKPRPDFHRMLAFLADSPELMRRLGLIVDLEFDDPLPPPTGVVRVEVSPMDPSVDLRPKTHYELTDKLFLTAPRPEGGLIEEGTLRLDWVDELFDFYQVDVDGGALKLIDFSQTLSSLGQLPALASPTPDQSSLPSLRSAGFTVSARARAVQLVESLDGSSVLNADVEADSAELYLEDVLRGYRLDVRDENASRWFPLQAREGTHRFLGTVSSGPATLGPITDEGFVRANAATSSRVDLTDPADPNKPGKPDLYLHEAMFGWDGWSLAAPRPGKIIVEPGEGDDDSHIAAEKIEAGTDLPLESVYRVADGTLPRLRFGNGYRMRARVVDLAGNGVSATEDDIDDHVTPTRRYLRYEPAASPAVVRRHPDTEGESLERMVIRSDVDLTPAEYVADPEVIAASSGAYTEDSQRHIAPPKGSVQMAELHGRLDGAFGAGGDPGAQFRVAAKEEGSFLDALVVDPATGSKDIDVSGDIKFHPEGEGPADPKDLPHGAGLPQGVSVYRPGLKLKLPYLPDPLAVGAAFFDLPGLAGTTLPVPYPVGSAWSDLDPFRVRLVGIKKGAGPASSQITSGVLVVTLPQAERVVARVSTLIDAAGRETLAIWDMLSDQKKQQLGADALAARLWVLTPYRYLEFVHAVQHPLEEPTVDFTPDRQLGATFSGFEGTVGNHAKSTGRLDVLAAWSEPLDSGAPNDPPIDGKDGRPAPEEKRAVAFGWDIGESEDAAWVNIGGQRVSLHEFGDTKHRRVRYRALATTRFREYFPASITEDPDNIQRLGPEKELSIPNSARPDAPTVLYVIPTFGWEEKPVNGGLSRTRRGGGLRVYLDRPWYSSGEREMLGVVTMPPPKKVKPDLVISGKAIAVERVGRTLRERTFTGVELAELYEASAVLGFPATVADARPYVTTWGKDPTWASQDPKPVLTYTDFISRAPESRTGLSIAEAPGAKVAVAAHEVAYDPDRELWYADLELSPEAAYFPFIRLALARFQPNSLDDAHLSPVVLSDFIQVVADRTASVSVSGTEATVSVSGIAPHNIVATSVHSWGFGIEPFAPNLSHSRKVSVTVQRRDPGVMSDLAWEDADDEVFLPLVPAKGKGRLWRGKVTLPSPTPAGTHRLLIREYEVFFTDYDPEIHPPISVITPGQPAGSVRRRVVYADTFEV